MEEAKPVRKLWRRPEETLALVKHSCNGKCCISEETMICDMLSLWWSTLLGETFGECFFSFSGVLSHLSLW